MCNDEWRDDWDTKNGCHLICNELMCKDEWRDDGVMLSCARCGCKYRRTDSVERSQMAAAGQLRR